MRSTSRRCSLSTQATEMRQLETLAAGLKADSHGGLLTGMPRSTGSDPLLTSA